MFGSIKLGSSISTRASQPALRALYPRQYTTKTRKYMGKKKSAPVLEAYLRVERPSELRNGITVPSPIIDTHTHLLSTFETYRKKYPEGYQTYHDFVRGFYRPQRAPSQNDATAYHDVETIVDVWCEAPVDPRWEEVANSAADETSRNDLWGGIEYWFVMGVHPWVFREVTDRIADARFRHQARAYTNDVEHQISAALTHPRNVGLGEIGLDYHYMNSPADVQKEVLRKQLRLAVSLAKPLTIHTREADEDIELILKEEVPRDHRIHVHCFTDTPGLAQRLLEHFPNLYIGVTGVLTYTTNANTAQVIRELVRGATPASFQLSSLRIVLETDAPYMVPSNIYSDSSLPQTSGKGLRLPISHSAMIPWTAAFVADIVNVEIGTTLDANDVLAISRTNGRTVYGV